MLDEAYAARTSATRRPRQALRAVPGARAADDLPAAAADRRRARRRPHRADAAVQRVRRPGAGPADPGGRVGRCRARCSSSPRPTPRNACSRSARWSRRPFADAGAGRSATARRPRRRSSHLLRGAGVELVVDVRTAPGSRRNPHVSRAELERRLPEHGFAYRWDKRLGGFRRPPPDSPDCFWRQEMFRGYAAHMRTPEFTEAIAELLTFDGAEARDVQRVGLVALPPPVPLFDYEETNRNRSSVVGHNVGRDKIRATGMSTPRSLWPPGRSGFGSSRPGPERRRIRRLPPAADGGLPPLIGTSDLKVTAWSTFSLRCSSRGRVGVEGDEEGAEQAGESLPVVGGEGAEQVAFAGDQVVEGGVDAGAAGIR